MMGKRSRHLLLGAIVAASWVCGGAVWAQDVLVVTALQPIFSLTSGLAEGTNIRVENAPGQGSHMAAQERFLAQPNLDPLFESADAVVTIGRVWNGDKLYSSARLRNIRVIEIDAAWPLDAESAPVGLTRKPCATAPWDTPPAGACESELSPYVWLSMSNGVRMAENIAADLKRLSPEDAGKIQANLAQTTGALRAQKSEYDNRFAGFADPRVFALADEFDYLFGEIGVFVDGHFTKEDVRWTPEDLQAFEKYLRDSDIATVIHKWEPAEEIRAAIDRAGAHLVVLDVGDPGIVTGGHLDPAGYMTILRRNLDMLAEAFSGP